MRKIIAILMIICAAVAGTDPASAATRRTKAKKAKTTKVTKTKAKPRISVARQPFVTRVDAPKAPQGLDGKNIALWQSHGRYSFWS